MLCVSDLLAMVLCWHTSCPGAPLKIMKWNKLLPIDTAIYEMAAISNIKPSYNDKQVQIIRVWLSLGLWSAAVCLINSLCDFCIREELIDIIQEDEQYTMPHIYRRAENYSNVLQIHSVWWVLGGNHTQAKELIRIISSAILHWLSDKK